MKLKKVLSLILSLLMLVSLCACGKNSSEPSAADKAEQTSDNAPEADTSALPQNSGPVEVVVTDMIGREVTIIPGSYRRVVCIGAGALRMYCYVGDLQLLCGVEDIDNLSLSERPKMFDSVARPYMLAYSNYLSTLPSCGVGGPNAQTAEAEKILACDPDIIISEYEDVDKENALQAQLGIPVITLRTGQNGVFDEPFRNSLMLLAQIFNAKDRADSLIAFVDAEIADLTARTAAVKAADSPGVYICGLGNWGTTNHLMTAQNYAPFNAINVRNVVTDLEKDGLQPLEEEKFAALGDDMDIMFIDTAAVKNIKPLYQEDSRMFNTCKAWKNGEVYIQMAYNAYYINYETSLINTWYIAKVVYPELFEDIDITAKANEITMAFLHVELAEDIFACPASFGGYGKIDTNTFFAE